MNTKNILVLGVKGSVVAFRRDTGEKLWTTHLKSSSFVSVATDDDRVYAHTGGELFCLDLFSGGRLWHDALKGLGYDVASIAGGGLGGIATGAALERYRQNQAAATAGAGGS